MKTDGQKKEQKMGKMSELDYLLQIGDKEVLEEFFIKRNFFNPKIYKIDIF